MATTFQENSTSHFPSMPLLLLLQFFFLLASSLHYHPSLHFFINAGSDSNLTLDDRDFLADVNPTSPLFSVPPGDVVTDSTSSPPSLLYRSARIFRQQSAYDFRIQRYGFFCLRLHFYAFNYGQINLEDAQFHASASNFSLLSDFSLPISDTPIIKEFFLTVNQSKLSIEFTPSHPKSFAFVNAIEVFLLPEDFVADTIMYTQTRDYFTGVLSQVLQTVHRVNIGGQPNQDPLWRNWVTDDEYLISKAFANTCTPYNGTIRYGTLGAGPFSASDLVYSTCRELNPSDTPIFPNITWVFPVTKNARNLVRLHFCNIVSTTPDSPKFHLNIYNFTQIIDTSDANASFSHIAAPFYYDFVVDSNDLGSLEVSVGAIRDSQFNNAFLNGLEIMEFGGKLNFVPNEQHSTSKKLVFIIIGSIGGSIFLLVLGALVFFGRKAQRKLIKQQAAEPWSSRPSTHGDKTSERTRTPYMSPVPNLNLHLKISLPEILDATHNFNAKLLIGEGGFGKVYKGTMRNGMRVAVKRSVPDHGQGIPEFKTEILVLSRIRHRHLVSLIGYCDDMSEMILVYEFMEKGTLRDHLYDGSNSNFLPWTQRLEICIGAARGLQYLHSGVDGGIIHRDVKSTNILLDENLVAKVADFGLSTAGPPDPDHFSMGIKGSFGYLDPEYFNTFQFTEKSDVYSFGVVLLEVLCGRPAIVESTTAEEVSLAEWGMWWEAKGELEKIIDPVLVGKVKSDSLRKYGETVKRCLSKNGEERPKMQQVVWDLEYVAMLEKSGVKREPHEDSNTKNSLQFSWLSVGRLPSFGSSLLIDKSGSYGGDGDNVLSTQQSIRQGDSR